MAKIIYQIKPKIRKQITGVFIAVLLSVFANAQKRDLNVNAGLWLQIEACISKVESGSSYGFIDTLIRKQVGNNPDSLFRNYYAVMIKLERGFKLRAAIELAQLTVKLAQTSKKPKLEAEAYMNLNRYYDALGIKGQAVIFSEKELAIYVKLKDTLAELKTRFHQLRQSMGYRKVHEVLPKLNELITDAERLSYTQIARKFHMQLISDAINAGELEQAGHHISEAEKIPISNPLTAIDYPVLILINQGKANLARARGKADEAISWLLKTLALTRQEPSKWVEVGVLNELATLEWERGNRKLAKAYLDTAQASALAIEAHDLLVTTYQQQSVFSEKEGRYKDALAFIGRRIAAEAILSKTADSFNIEAYYARLEKDKMALKAENQRLRLNNTLIILALVVVVAIGFFLAYINQRRKKMLLASKNKLITRDAEAIKNLDEAKSHFFANVSHELRTPLTLIMGPVQALLKSSNLNENQIKLLQTAKYNTGKLKLMVNNVLDFRKLELGKMELDAQPTALDAFFCMQLSQFESYALQKNVEYSFNVLVEGDMAACIDREKYRQIVYNLLSNAFKFTPSGGTVQVEIKVQDQLLLGKFADTGAGILAADLPSIFDRFYQSAQNKKLAAAGTGIGLSICKEYLQLMNGYIHVECPVTGGAIFTFSVPLLTANVTAPLEPIAHETLEIPALVSETDALQIRSTNTHNSKPIVMVVEDNSQLLDYLSLVLSADYQVITAIHGGTALDKLAERDPNKPIDLIISDLMMPVMDGYELLQKLKTKDETRLIPVIMLTARTDVQDKLKALRIGVDDYITKPFDEEELLARVENLLRNKAVRNENVNSTSEENGFTEQTNILGADKDWLENFEVYIKNNISNEFLTIPNISSEFAMSESTLLRQVKRLTGLTTLQYLQEVRLSEARQLLENRTYKSIAEVAAKIGYADTRSFTRRFKSRFGKSPVDMV